MNVMGPIAASMAVRMSWAATAAAAPRALLPTPSGASVWVSRGGQEGANPLTRICPEWATGNHPPPPRQDVGISTVT